MAQQKTITCLLCREEVDFTHLENQTYLDHLHKEHHIEYYRQLTLMVNLLDRNCLNYYSNMTPVSKPKTLVCFLCRKENNFGDDKGDEYLNHLRNDHKIISNLQLIRSISLMDNDGLRGIIKKFEEIYEVDDDDDINNEENDAEKMLIENGATFDDSKATSQPDEEEMYGELEEELINGSEAINYYKYQSVDSDSMSSHHINNQSESFLNDSNKSNTSLSDDQMNLMEDATSYAFQSNSSLNTSINFPSGREFDSMTKSEISDNLSYEASNAASPPRKRTTKAKVETSDFSEAVRDEVEKGNLSTAMEISFEQTLKVMKEITIMFMKGTACTLCVKTFKTKSHLHEHIESIHNPFEVYFCPVCQLTMTNSNKHRHHKKSKKCSTGQPKLKFLE